MGGTRRLSSSSPRRRRNNRIEDASSVNFLSNILIWVAASSSLICVGPSVLQSVKTSSEFIDNTIDTFQQVESKLYGSMESNDYYYDAPAYKPFSRPAGLRWRDDSRMFDYFSNAQMMPILTEQRSQSPFGRFASPSSRPTTSTRRQQQQQQQQQSQQSQQQEQTVEQAASPSLEDIELIDILWRSDIAMEKGVQQVAPAEQYENDLRTLTEKSTMMPLSSEEHARYEDLSKEFYHDFYNPFGAKMATLPSDSRNAPIPTDEDLADLLEDVSKEEGQLNRLGNVISEVPRGLIHNVSMSEAIVYSQNNLTEMQSIRDLVNELPLHHQTPAPPTTLFNQSDVTAQQWIQSSEYTPNDVFPQSNYSYDAPNVTIPVASNDIVEHDHSYHCSPNMSSGGSEEGNTTNRSSPAFDSYHANRHSISESLTNSSSSCSRLSSESPRCNHNENENMSRFYGKLIPKDKRSSYPNLGSSMMGEHIPRVVPITGQRKRGRQSKDEQLASENGLPVSARKISEMSLVELQNVLKNEKLTEYQRELIRKIRRRGKNKLAARTCRQRRSDRTKDRFCLNVNFKMEMSDLQP